MSYHFFFFFFLTRYTDLEVYDYFLKYTHTVLSSHHTSNYREKFFRSGLKILVRGLGRYHLPVQMHVLDTFQKAFLLL